LLVVEDDPELLEVLSVCLEDDDHEVRSAVGFSGAVELLQREAFDLVLTDLCAREYSAQALLAVQAFARTAPTTPVVLATAHAEAAALDPAAYGLAGVILKPFDLNELLARVRDMISEQ
jgi:DNA-binding NtrC family response regulator